MKAATMQSVKKSIQSLRSLGGSDHDVSALEDDSGVNNLPNIPSLATDSEEEDGPSTKSKDRRKLMAKAMSFRAKRAPPKKDAWPPKKISHIGEVDTDAIRKKLAEAKKELEITVRKLAAEPEDDEDDTVSSSALAVSPVFGASPFLRKSRVSSCLPTTGRGSSPTATSSTVASSNHPEEDKKKRKPRRSRSAPRLELDLTSGEAVQLQEGAKKPTRRRPRRGRSASGLPKLISGTPGESVADDKSTASDKPRPRKLRPGDSEANKSWPRPRTSKKTKRRSNPDVLLQPEGAASPLRLVETDPSSLHSKKERHSKSSASVTKPAPNTKFKAKKERQPKKTTNIAEEDEEPPRRSSKPEKTRSLRPQVKRASSARIFTGLISSRNSDGKTRRSPRNERAGPVEERPALQRASSARGIRASKGTGSPTQNEPRGGVASTRSEKTSGRPNLLRASSARALPARTGSMPVRRRLQRAASAKGLSLMAEPRGEETHGDAPPALEDVSAMSRQKRRPSRLHRGSTVNTQVAQLQLQQLESRLRDAEKSNRRMSKREKMKKESIKMLEADYATGDEVEDEKESRRPTRRKSRLGLDNSETGPVVDHQRRGSSALTLQNLFNAEPEAAGASDAKSVVSALSIVGPITKKPTKAAVPPPESHEPTPFADLDDSALVQDNMLEGFESQSNITFAASA